MIVDEADVPSYRLPDSLIFQDGEPVRTAADWAGRRHEILDLFAEHVYGRTPVFEAATDLETLEEGVALDGDAVRRQSLLWIDVGAPIRIRLLEYAPAQSSSPCPTIVVPSFGGNHAVDTDPAIFIDEAALLRRPDLAARGSMSHRFPLRDIVAAGFRCAVFDYEDVVRDVDDLGGGSNPLFPRACVAREPQEWGAIAAWAWGASRVVDRLIADPGVDRERIVLAGHSRLGKAALWAAAQDDRMAAVFANDSGCTGAAISRRRFGETLSAINAGFPHWFCRNYHAYAERESALPVDQHQLIAAIAPRLVYVASASQDLWADPRGEYLGALHASPVFRLLGSEGLTLATWPPAEHSRGAIGYHLREGAHEMLASDWRSFLAFLSRTPSGLRA